MTDTALLPVPSRSLRRRPAALGARLGLPTDPALRGVYEHDARRAGSAELDVGLRWRSLDGSTYRAAWIESTRELYSVRHGGPADERPISVLALIDADALERELEGWRELCKRDRPGSYEWLVEHAAAAGRPCRFPVRSPLTRKDRAHARNHTQPN